jgi:hypothetical protein
MALTPQQEQREHELRVIQTETYIEKMRKELAYENRKFVVQLVAGLATAFAAGVGALALVLHYAVHQ